MASIPVNVFFEILALVISVGMVYVALTNRITRIEERMEERQKHMEREQEIIVTGINALKETTSQILIKLENKANRT